MKIDLTTDKDYFRPDIQGLRGVAVLLVVIYHTGLALPGGFIGVDMFFVISGFVITQLLLRESDQNGKISLKNFYYRRARRLIPALSIVIIFTLVSSVFVMSPFGEQQQIVKTAIASTFFAGNIHLFAMNTYDALKDNPLRHLWSLGVEEQFYLIYPLVFLSICKFSTVSNFRKRLLGTLTFFMTSSFLLSALLSSGFEFGYKNGSIIHQNLSFLTNIGFVAGGDWPTKFAFFGAPSRFWEILLGALIAVGFSSKNLFPYWFAKVMTLISALAVIATALFLTTEANFPGLFAVIPVFATGILIVFGEEKTLVNRIFSAYPLVRLGDVSYSLYLWHWPIIVFSRAIWPGTSIAPLVAAALSFGIANFSYLKIENPYNKRVNGTVRSSLNLVGLSVLIVALSFGGFSVANSGLGFPRVETKWENLASTSGCEDGKKPGDPSCLFGVDAPKFSGVLFGDSNARSASDGVVRAVRNLGGEISISWKSGCSFQIGGIDQNCRQLNDKRLRFLTDRKPDFVVIVNYLNYFSEDTEILINRLNVILDELRIRNIPVIVQGQIPECFFRISLIRYSAQSIRYCEVKLTDQASRNQILVQSRLLTEKYPLNTFVDPADSLCDSTLCEAFSRNKWIYSDSKHLSKSGSMLLAPLFEDAIRQSLKFISAKS